MPVPLDVVKCYKYIDLNAKRFIEELRYLVKIPNVSSDLTADEHIAIVIHWVCARLRKLGFTLLLKQCGQLRYKNNPPPPVIIATYGKDPKKKTLLYYCHLDVLKVDKKDWNTDPFELIEKDGKLYGRGAAKMKGPLLCFLHALEAYNALNIELPINIKLIGESMFEVKNRGLRWILAGLKTTYLADVDCVLLNESQWIGTDYPCIVYGMRGVCYFNLIIDGANKDLSSGDYGGVVREPMHDFIHIMKSLVDARGRIYVPNFYDDIVPVTPDEEEFYKKIKMEVAEYRNFVGVKKLDHNENLKLVLMHVWRYPWFNLHYVNTPCDGGNLLDIPRKVVSRFSIRMVPNQTHERVSESVLSYVKEIIKNSKTPNKIEFTAEFPLNPWYENHLHWNYEAANIATKQVYKEEASFIREGNGFPTLLKLQDSIPGRNILILPIVNVEARSHRSNENISVRCYIEGTKLLASYFYELHQAAKRHEKNKIGRNSVICNNTLSSVE